ncbi:MAG: alkaline phosphatase family protein [Acidobacteria bacterium]|nr:alkaline phosphatase family protein [Acidobacteriota bacterium]
MKLPFRRLAVVLLVLLWQTVFSFGSAYNGQPKLIVVVVIDQFRGDYLARYQDEYVPGGFRLFLERGANFTDCNYNYVNTITGPGHATLFTGAYSNGHGIRANEWWDPEKKKFVTSVEDDDSKLVGIGGKHVGSSPHNLQADTLGDELRLATQGKSRVFGISLKDRAAVLPAGFAGNGAYWIDAKTGAWVTSTYYRPELPAWAEAINQSGRAEKLFGLEWKDKHGNVLRTTKKTAEETSFFELVGPTPYSVQYELDFAQELIRQEKLGTGPATDFLSVSLSANDILGHDVGPDTPQMHAMALALDEALAGFFHFLDQQVGLDNVWIALSADHGVAPAPAAAQRLHIPATGLDGGRLVKELNAELSAKFSPTAAQNFVRDLDYPSAYVNEDAFGALKISEDDAERAVGEALVKVVGMRGFYTRAQLARGDVPNTELGAKYLHSYSPLGGWFVIGVPTPFTIGYLTGTSHGTPYTYDTHVPLSFYGKAFRPGYYRGHSEPVDLAATLASLLGINAPTHAVGRVLSEALAEQTGASHATKTSKEGQ